MKTALLLSSLLLSVFFVSIPASQMDEKWAWTFPMGGRALVPLREKSPCDGKSTFQRDELIDDLYAVAKTHDPGAELLEREGPRIIRFEKTIVLENYGNRMEVRFEVYLSHPALPGTQTQSGNRLLPLRNSDSDIRRAVVSLSHNGISGSTAIHDFLRQFLLATEAIYRQRPERAECTSGSVAHTATDAKPPIQDVKRTIGAGRFAWVVTNSPEKSAVTLSLREKMICVGTSGSKRTIYQVSELSDDFRASAMQLDSKTERYGFALIDIRFSVAGHPYQVSALYRAKSGALEEDQHAVIAAESDESRVAVYLTGPDASIREKIISTAASLYEQRPPRIAAGPCQ